MMKFTGLVVVVNVMKVSGLLVVVNVVKVRDLLVLVKEENDGFGGSGQSN